MASANNQIVIDDNDSDMDDIEGALAGISPVGAENDPLADLDLSGVQDGYRLIPIGTEVDAVITESLMGKTQAGKPKITLKLRVTTPEFKGVTIFDTVPIMEQTYWRVKSLFAAVDMLSEDGSRITGRAQDLVNQTVGFKVTHDTYTDKNNQTRTKNKVDGRFVSAS